MRKPVSVRPQTPSDWGLRFFEDSMLTSGGCCIQLWRESGQARATRNRSWQLARAFLELKSRAARDPSSRCCPELVGSACQC